MIPDTPAPSAPDLSREFALLRRHGDRTNALLTLAPDFSSFFPEDGQAVVRFVRAGRTLVAAGEPLGRAEDRAEALAGLARANPGVRVCVMPVGERLAGELQARGFSVWQVGCEPVFRLDEFFAALKDPLLLHPVARSLKRRGGEVSEVPWTALAPGEPTGTRAALDELVRLWQEGKSGPALGFLSAARPFHLASERRYFLLRVRGDIQGVVSAAPFFRDGAILGYYFADILRHPEAKAGGNDLLVCEAMRLLHEEGVPEVRLGMCPLAGLDPAQPGGGLLTALFRRWTLGYNFRSLHEFKAKFMPTRWDPLFLASTEPSLARALATALRAHLPGGPGGFVRSRAARIWSGLNALNPRALASLGLDTAMDLAPRSLGDFFRRTRNTTALMAGFVLLHVLRLQVPAVDALFRRSAYVPGDLTPEGLLLGPFFHNHWFHLVGDQLTFYAAGCLVELTLGPLAFWLITGLGLWLSNPMTHGLYALFLERVDPKAWAFLLQEPDYGSSNAAFALVGAYCALLRRKSWLFLPFFLSGLVIGLERQSLLALHHLLTLFAGYLGVLAWMALSPRSAPKG